MPNVRCSNCRVNFTLGDERAGTTFNCLRCHAPLTVPEVEPQAPPASPPPPSRPPVPSAAPTRGAVYSLDDEPEIESGPTLWDDKRFRRGVFAGVGVLAALLIVCVIAFRKPAETASRDPAPTPPAVAPAVLPPKPEPASVPSKPAPATIEAVLPERPSQPPTVTLPESSPVLPEFVRPGGGQELTMPAYKTKFLGSEGEGRRFCIIADNSGSMSGANINDLKVQLRKTVDAVTDQGEFYVYCFNSRTEPMPHSSWVRGGAPELAKIRTWIGDIRATGGTQPTPAFEAAFRLNPRPDIIFFMTDGLIPANVPTQVAALNTGTPKVVVNTIMFGPTQRAMIVPKGVVVPKGFGMDRAEEYLKKIAEQSGGTFNRYTPTN